jgi:hypothetical protein
MAEKNGEDTVTVSKADLYRWKEGFRNLRIDAGLVAIQQGMALDMLGVLTEMEKAAAGFVVELEKAEAGPET